jgi:hypothetical protein
MIYGGYRWAGVAGFFPWDNLWQYDDSQRMLADPCAIPRKQTTRLFAGRENRLLGTDHMLRPFRIERVTLEGSQHVLAATLGNRDVALYSPHPLPHGRYWVGGNTFSHVIDNVQFLRPLARGKGVFFDSVGGLVRHEGREPPGPAARQAGAGRRGILRRGLRHRPDARRGIDFALGKDAWRAVLALLAVTTGAIVTKQR